LEEDDEVAQRQAKEDLYFTVEGQSRTIGGALRIYE
jgi:hypothetical protein